MIFFIGTILTLFCYCVLDFMKCEEMCAVHYKGQSNSLQIVHV
jgi:hypothetical protein